MDIALTVGGSFLSSFLQVLFDRISLPEFLDLFRKRKFDDRILKKLKRKLWIVLAVLEDAESKQSKNEAVHEWLDELLEVVHQADDLLDQINTEALRVKVESKYPSPTDQVSASTDPSNFITESFKEIMLKLEEIVQTLEDFEKEIGSLGIKEVGWIKQPFRSPSTTLVDESDVYGRDADKKNIIKALFSFSDDVADRESVSVISIVGLGGIGKTTLAQLVYNDEWVNERFEFRAWVCISQDYDAMRITKELLEKLDVHYDSNNCFDSLQVKLKERLFNRRFLLVLDDIWNRDYNHWLALYAPLKTGSEGSKIIATTRDGMVAFVMGSQYIYHLDLMLGEDCWSLFKKIAFINRDATDNLEFELIGKEFLRKCGGLPLAVKAVAHLLRSKKTIKEWDEILRRDAWAQSYILPSLRLSYAPLPSCLKRCFAYCAVFHKDYQFSKDEVILLWMANDLLGSPGSNKRLEDIGDEFFHELTIRSFFQQSSDGKFYMHDLVNDLAKFVSGKYVLRLENHWRQNGSLIVMRHFSYISRDYDVFEEFELLNESKFLRTFLPLAFHGKENWGNRLSKKLLLDILPASKFLRVLSLCGYGITELQMPNSFANLKQLRFLDLSFTEIKRLPSWICMLYNLQTLLLAGCKYLKEFPKDMEKLINLRHLDISGVPLTQMPMDIGRLESLQSLSTFVVSKCSGTGIEKLGRLCNLQGELTIYGLENVANGKNASMAEMKGKKYINKLTLEWSSDSNGAQLVQDVLEELQPHSNIKHLKIKGYCGTRFPSWLEYPLFFHMISLCLSNCENCIFLPAIGQLPSLKHLTISGLSKVIEIGKEFYGNTKPFPCLKELRIEDMGEWKEWHGPENGVFSCLEELYIDDCPKLIGEIPKQLPLLRNFVICRCPKLTGEIPTQLPSLRMLTISDCLGLVNCDGGLTIFDCKADSLEQLCSLRELGISRMPNLKELSSSSLSDLNILLPRLEKLEIGECEDIVSFPINRLPTTLKQLMIEDCGNLELETRDMTHMSLQDLYISGAIYSLKNISLSSFPTLQRLHILGIRNIEELSIQQGNQVLTSLESLSIHGCDNFMSFPAEGLHAPYLTEIRLSNLPKLKSLPEMMHILLPSLRDLYLRNCPEIECFPEWGLPSNLQSLYISYCQRLWSCCRGWGLQRLISLTSFSFFGTHEQKTWPPEDLLLPSTLRSLSLGNHKNLKTLNYSVLQHLTRLESLSIWNCPKLQSLPEEGLPASLSQLFIYGCQLLQPRSEWKEGEDWPKVARIPYVEVDYV